MKRRDFLRIAATGFISSVAAHATSAEPLRLSHTIPLPGVKGRFDHFAYDHKSRRLIVAALGNNTGEVFDVAQFKHLHTIPDLRKPTGALVLTDSHRFYFANGDDGTFRSFDPETYSLKSQIRGLDDADNVRYDAASSLIYVGYGDGALGVVDTGASKLLHSIPLAAHPESFQLESNGPRIFVNVPDKKHVAVVDRVQKRVITTWPMERAQANFPMAYAAESQRLFVGCRRPARLVVLDSTNGKQVAEVEISGDTDDLFFDAKRQRIYISCGEGFIDVVERHEGDRYERTARIATRAGARTSFFSPDLDCLFLAVPEHGGQPAELRVYQPQ